MKTGKWKLIRLNQTYQMARANGDGIEHRLLNWFEKIIYYFRLK